MTKSVKAWHFTPVDRRLRYGDDREVIAGETIKIDCEPVLCRSGLHASRDILDALSYAPGPYVWRVVVGGAVVLSYDKLVGTERTALWGFDASELLRRFARRCALDVIDNWDAPQVVRDWLVTGDESLRSAAYNAAWGAAYNAAWGAAYNAARSAAESAARSAAESVAWSVDCEKQRRRLTSMVCAEHRRLEVNDEG